MKANKPHNRKIHQIIPAQPDTWAIFGESHETVELSLPVICWCLTEEQGRQEVEARVADNYGNTTFADSSINFLGIVYCRSGEVPPNARTVLLVNDQYQVFADLKADGKTSH